MPDDDTNDSNKASEEAAITKEELFSDIDHSKNKTMDQSSIDDLLAGFLSD